MAGQYLSRAIVPKGMIERRKPKGTTVNAIRDSAKGELCTLLLDDVCVGGTETTVWAHANGVQFGKGFALKVPDYLGAYACMGCHFVYDKQTKRPAHLTVADVELAFWRGHAVSLMRLFQKGIIHAS